MNTLYVILVLNVPRDCVVRCDSLSLTDYSNVVSHSGMGNSINQLLF